MGWLTDYMSPQDLAAQGRNGDTMLAHINPQEAALLKSLGGSGTVNPNTGLPEFFLDDISDFAGDVWDAGSDLVSGAGDIVSDLGSAVGDLGSSVDDLVNEIPGGWLTVAAMAGGYADPSMFGAESAGGTEALSGLDLGGAGAGADTWGAAMEGSSLGQGSNILAADTSNMIGADWEQMPGQGMFGGSAVNQPIASATPWSLSSSLGSAGDWMKANPLKTAKIGSSLYDMYAKNQMAKQLGAARTQQQNAINNFYAPGSAEYNQLQQQMARKAAAGGHSWSNAQFASSLAAAIADKKMNALTSNAKNQNELLAQQLGSKYTSLGSLFKTIPELLK